MVHSSPSKSNTSDSSKILSPPKKKLSSVKIKSGGSRIRNRILCEALGLPIAGLSRYWTERVPNCDAFSQPVVVKIQDDSLLPSGFIMSTSTRQSVVENLALKNQNNDYNRRSFIRITSEQNRETRSEGQQILKAILMHPDNNRYGSVFSAEDEDDYTVFPHRYPDEVLLDATIVDVIYAMYDNVDNQWYSRFPDLARSFFTPNRQFPRCAVVRLGYPEENELIVPVGGANAGNGNAEDNEELIDATSEEESNGLANGQHGSDCNLLVDDGANQGDSDDDDG